MSVDPLVIALPSKGRIHDPVASWLAARGVSLARDKSSRGYSATLAGISGVEVRLLSASEVAPALADGKVHVGVTGLDLLSERPGGVSAQVHILSALGLARARVVVAIPEAWVDVETMEDLRDAAARYHETTRGRLRVATKFRHLTRRFFAEHGLLEYRIAPSLGATEGAPAAGTADLIVDITGTGTTLAANHLRILDDGVVLESEAVLAATLAAVWTQAQHQSFRRLMERLGPDAHALRHFERELATRSLAR